nr:MAG TPA: hypothetical protein [Caudoviricetes sp.]
MRCNRLRLLPSHAGDRRGHRTGPGRPGNRNDPCLRV